jgi:hypothetical protein
VGLELGDDVVGVGFGWCCGRVGLLRSRGGLEMIVDLWLGVGCGEFVVDVV